MLNIFKLVGIIMFISVEANKAARGAIAQKRAEILDLLAKLRKEFDEAVVESLVGHALELVIQENRISKKEWKSLRKEMKSALGLDGKPEKEDDSDEE